MSPRKFAFAMVVLGLVGVLYYVAESIPHRDVSNDPYSPQNYHPGATQAQKPHPVTGMQALCWKAHLTEAECKDAAEHFERALQRARN